MGAQSYHPESPDGQESSKLVGLIGEDSNMRTSTTSCNSRNFMFTEEMINNLDAAERLEKGHMLYGYVLFTLFIW